MQSLRIFFGRNADLALVGLVIGVLLVLFAPVPARLLDILLLANVSFALLILLVTVYAPRPVDFSTFPAILLVATLFRLALNVSATRLILSEANAGQVIGAIGSFVVGGNYVIGLIVFLILIVVQYAVVTSGAQRVSEVAARFTLDSMPGQQMSIDADLNMGFIDQQQAKQRRKNLEREAAFYGAMDGASKFVKGDAIAGIVIVLINIIGGLIIGVLQMKMSWGDALRQYTLLTIGDGIVTQIPALVLAVGTGLIVTRSGSDSTLGLEVLRQITAYPRAILIVAAALAGIALLPGMPMFSAAGLMMLLAFIYAASLYRGKATAEQEAQQDSSLGEAPANPYGTAPVEPLEMTFGSGLARTFGDSEKSLLLQRISEFRDQYAHQTGLILPKIKFKDSVGIQPHQYEISVFGDVVAWGDVVPDQLLAIHPMGNTSLIPGKETKDPTYGLPALWIDPSQRDHARAAKYTLVDPMTLLVTHLGETLRQHAPQLLTRTETDRMLAGLRVVQPGLVEELVPTVLSVTEVQKVLQGLMKEAVPIRNLQVIIETLIDGAKITKEAPQLIEICRQRLASSICNALSSDKKVLHVLTLHPELEGELLQLLAGADKTQLARSDPRLTENLLLKLAKQAEKMMKSSLTPVLLCQVELRRHVRALTERALPHLRVLSVAEVPMQFELKSFSSIGHS
jgi:flagellar biosynthesis protein FlhA